MMISNGKQENSDKDLLASIYFTHQESYLKATGNEQESAWWEARIWPTRPKNKQSPYYVYFSN
jgi:hypothetical protein